MLGIGRREAGEPDLTQYAGYNPFPAQVSVKLRDPWPDNPNSLAMTWQELQSRFIGLVFIGVTMQP